MFSTSDRTYTFIHISKENKLLLTKTQMSKRKTGNVYMRQRNDGHCVKNSYLQKGEENLKKKKRSNNKKSDRMTTKNTTRLVKQAKNKRNKRIESMYHIIIRQREKNTNFYTLADSVSYIYYYVSILCVVLYYLVVG